MFAGASSFSHSLSSWDLSSVKEMKRMFEGATSYKHDLARFEGERQPKKDLAKEAKKEEEDKLKSATLKADRYNKGMAKRGQRRSDGDGAALRKAASGSCSAGDVRTRRGIGIR